MSIIDSSTTITAAACARPASNRPHLLMLAYACHPHNSMEERNGWQRALQAAQDFDVTVFTAPDADIPMLRQSVPSELRGRLDFQAISAGPKADRCCKIQALFYYGYNRWQRAAARRARELNEIKPFSLSHLVSICGYREPGYVWEMPFPFIWGPIGGTGNYPFRFLPMADLRGACFEVVRTCLNAMQLRLARRVRKAMVKSAKIFAANSTVKNDFKNALGIDVDVDIESGIDFDCAPLRELRPASAPLNILWVGRLQTWKALPILLHAIARLPKDVPCSLRVVGDGPKDRCWQELARRLKISDRIDWTTRPHYRDSFHHYLWADAFAFTSLRDTSGTGLFESLAFGLPIIGFAHHGAADMLDESCSIPIPVRNPSHAIESFAAAITALYRDKERLQKLSHGASQRARHFVWSERHRVMRTAYLSALQNAPCEASVLATS